MKVPQNIEVIKGNYSSKRSHCNSRLSDQFFDAQRKAPCTTSKKLVFKFNFDESEFDLTMFKKNRVRNRIDKSELTKLTNYLKKNVTNYDIESIDLYYKQMFLLSLLLSQIITVIVLLCITISIQKKHYKPVFIMPFLLIILTVLNKFLDVFIYKKVARILEDRGNEISNMVNVYNENEFINNGIKLETGLLASWIELHVLNNGTTKSTTFSSRDNSTNFDLGFEMSNSDRMPYPENKIFQEEYNDEFSINMLKSASGITLEESYTETQKTETSQRHCIKKINLQDDQEDKKYNKSFIGIVENFKATGFSNRSKKST